MADHNGSVTKVYQRDGSLRPVYPPPPKMPCPPNQKCCPSTIDYVTLPEKYPYRDTILGPTSLKHLYKGAWNYPPQVYKVPEGTMYDVDSSSYGAFGKRETYHRSLYPYLHRSPHETRSYTGKIAPVPNLFEWTQYPVMSDGAWGK